MRSRIFLLSGLMVVSAFVVMASSAAAAITPIGPFTGTATNFTIKTPSPAHEWTNTITCKSAGISGNVKTAETGQVVSGYQPPTFSGCTSSSSFFGSGTVTITSSTPFVSFGFSWGTGTFRTGASGFRIHVKIEQPFVFCEAEMTGALTGSGSVPITQMALSSPNISVSGSASEGVCWTQFGEGHGTASGTFTLNHALNHS